MAVCSMTIKLNSGQRIILYESEHRDSTFGIELFKNDREDGTNSVQIADPAELSEVATMIARFDGMVAEGLNR